MEVMQINKLDSTLFINDPTSFVCGQKVIVKYENRFFLAIIVNINTEIEQCTVEFKNHKQTLISFQNIWKTKLTGQGSRCRRCRYKSKYSSRKIITCCKCFKGYHANCYSSHIPERYYYEGEIWMCNACVRLQSDKVNQTKRKSVRQAKQKRKNKLKLPYKLNVLQWNADHRTNAQELYCYCGLGNISHQMLQCERCKQWFHGKCIKSLKFPLLKGDRFYVFVCMICNNGKEFLYRLKLTWLNLVHLILFNIALTNTHKLFDINKIILFFAKCNWTILQLSPEIENVAEEERYSHFISVLINNGDIFINGQEEQKGIHLWGLRLKEPPIPPSITLPETDIITEELIKNQISNTENIVDLNINETIDDNEMSLEYELVNEIKIDDEIIQIQSNSSEVPSFLSNSIIKHIPIINNSENTNNETVSSPIRIQIPSNSLAPDMFLSIAIPYTVAVLRPDGGNNKNIVTSSETNRRNKNQLSQIQSTSKKTRFTPIAAKGKSVMRLIKIT